jgi:hypothetical protein
MSDRSTASRTGQSKGLPEWARARESERRGFGSSRLAETTVLILVGLFLAVANVDDVVRQTHVNHRLIADMHSWRAVTGHDYRNLTTEQDVKRHTTSDTVCGNISPGGPKERTQVCLVLVGPVISGRRTVSGGYYLPAQTIDERRSRYGCFGVAAETGLCGLSKPPAGASPDPPLPTGR